MTRRAQALAAIATCGALLSGGEAAADLAHELARVEARWGELRSETGKGGRLEAYEALADEAEQVRRRHPRSAKAWIWEAIALAGYADARSDMRSLAPLRASRAAYERSIELDDAAFAGFAYAHLGTLYHRVPAWPISYGDDDRARELLRRGVDADPESLDTHFEYGRFLLDVGEYAGAIEALERALTGGPGPIHARHHDARMNEVRTALERARLAHANAAP